MKKSKNIKNKDSIQEIYANSILVNAKNSLFSDYSFFIISGVEEGIKKSL